MKEAPENNIYELLKSRADRYPDIFAIAAPGRFAMTYQRLFRQAEEVVESLNNMGIGRGDRVGIVLPNGPEMAVSFLTVSAGATSAPLNPTYGAREFEFYLSDLGAKAVIVQAGTDSPVRGVANDLGIPTFELVPQPQVEAGVFTLEGERRPDPMHGGFTSTQDVALVLHTSGTTSRPKIVPLTHTNICASARNIQETLALTYEDLCLNVMPLFHIHGLMGATLSTITAGGCIVCTPGFEAEKFYEWLGTHCPTWYSAVPTMHQAVLAAAAGNYQVIAANPLRFIRSSSASLPPRVMAELERVFNAPVIESYGMTEASHQMTSNPLPPRPRKPGSVGLAAGPQVAFMDADGVLLPPGKTGEIVIRGENVTAGYENNPQANQDAFEGDWFRTGDEGYFDEEGYLFITGRIKEMINRGGEKVAPREVDEALMEHPAVAQVVTFAVPHETLGEDVAAAVVLKEGNQVTQKDLRDFAFSRLAGFKIPSQVLIVNEIPKGPTGKLQRIGLAEQLADQLEAPHREPQGAIETALAMMWVEVLGLEQVGVYDNFFASGGDSLLASQLNARISTAYEVELPANLIFLEPTIAELAPTIERILLDEIEALSEDEAQRLVDSSE